MPGKSFAKIITNCELLSATLKPALPEMTHLQSESTELDEFITETKGLSNEQELLTGRLREITRLRQEAERRGVEIRGRIAAQLQGKLGFKNENLLGFGITPRKRERKKPERRPVPPVAGSSASGVEAEKPK